MSIISHASRCGGAFFKPCTRGFTSAALLLLGVGFHNTAHAEYGLWELGRSMPYFPSTANGQVVADFDGDGKDDVTVVATHTALDPVSALQVMGATRAGIGAKWTTLLESTSIVETLAWQDDDGKPQLLLIDALGLATVRTGWPLQWIRQFAVDPEIRGGDIGDIDVDGRLELVTINDHRLGVFDLETGNYRWSLPYGGYDVTAAQLDADLPLEIVVARGSSSPGLIIGGADQSVKWSYLDGFGNYLAHGAIGPDGAPGLVAARIWDVLTVFQSGPWSPVWDFEAFNIGSVAEADLDGDGQDEIIEGDAQWGEINILDTRTHGKRASIPNPGYSAQTVGAFDPHGTGKKLVTFGSSGVPLYVADPETGGLIVGEPNLLSGPYSAVVLGDFNRTGRMELMFGSGDGYESSRPGVLSTIDPETGDIGWQSPAETGNMNDVYAVQPTALRFSGNKLLVAGTSSYTGRLFAVNIDTHEVAWRVGHYASGPMDNRRVSGMALWDVTGDGIDDAILSTHAVTTGASGARLHVFSGANGDLVWESVIMGGGFFGSTGVLAGVIDPAIGPEMVAVLPNGLRAYSVETKLLDWVLNVEADGASLIESGANGSELAVFHGSTLQFYDSVTRDLLRSFTLEGNVTAVQELDGLDRLLVAVGNRLTVLDGTDGTVQFRSDFLGAGLAADNQLAAVKNSHGMWLVGAGSSLGIYRFCLGESEEVFRDDFEHQSHLDPPAVCRQ